VSQSCERNINSPRSNELGTGFSLKKLPHKNKLLTQLLPKGASFSHNWCSIAFTSSKIHLLLMLHSSHIKRLRPVLPVFTLGFSIPADNFAGGQFRSLHFKKRMDCMFEHWFRFFWTHRTQCRCRWTKNNYSFPCFLQLCNNSTNNVTFKLLRSI